MFKTLAVAGAATVLVSILGTPTAMAAPSWAMPSLQGMNLAKAQSLFTETVGDQGPQLQYVSNASIFSGSVRSLSTWQVCKQAPAAGKKIAAKSQTVVTVNRPGKC